MTTTPESPGPAKVVAPGRLVREHAAMSETPPELRVGDRERKVVDDRLLAAVGDGVLTLSEYDERTAALWQARTRSELDGLVADLPRAVEGPAPVEVPAATRPQRVVAVMSEDRLADALAPGQRVEGYALMGKAVVDLRREDLPDGTRVRVRSLMGEVEVQVPPGAVVRLSGFSLMGERKVAVAPGGGPVVHVDAIAVMGSVKVGVGDGAVVPRRTHGLGHVPHARPAPAPVPSAPSATSSRRPARHGRGRLGRALTGAKGLLVPAAVLGAVVLAGPDNVSIFGSSVERAADRSVQVSTLFGSTTVIVPDGSRVDTSGIMVFGSTDCEQACTSGQGEVVEVRRFGAFGSVEIVTESEWEQERRDDDDGPVELEGPGD